MQILCKLKLTRFSFLKLVIIVVTSFYGRHLIVNSRYDSLFPIDQGMLPWQPVLGSNGLI